MYTTTRKKKNFFSKIPVWVRICSLFLIAVSAVVFTVGPQRAWWEVKSRVENIISTNGPAKSFIDPIFTSQKDQNSQKQVSFKVGLVSDSHNDTLYYPRILQEIKNEKVDFIYHLGDTVDAGSINDLQAAKKWLDDSGIPYRTLCGNHDRNFWPTIEDKNYQTVFGDTYYSFTYKDAHFIALNNSDEFAGIDETQWNWLKNDLESDTSKLTFIMMHIPPYHPFLTHTMMSGEDAVQKQAVDLLKLSATYKVNEIFSGHLHSFSRYIEPDSGMKITVVGASGSSKNLVPGYAIFTVYTDGTYDVESKVLTQDSKQ